MQVKEYESMNFAKVVGYDVLRSSYEDVERIARFETEADANKFRDKYNDDLRRGLTVLRLRGELDLNVETERMLIMDKSAYVSAAYEIPIIPKGGELPPSFYDGDYGWQANQPTDASEE
jgi:hypothetical protein